MDSVEIRERATWDGFVSSHANGHLLQSWRWGEFRAAWGWTPRRLLFSLDGAPVAALQILLRPTPLGPLAYAARGPVCAPDAPWLGELFEAVARATTRAFAVRFEPGWPDGSVRPEHWGLLPAPDTQPRSTAVVDLTSSEEELRAALHPKWRYNLGLAARRGVVVREGSDDDLGAFATLMASTARRDGFHSRPAEYYSWAWRAFRPDAHLLIAEREGEPLAAIMSFHFGQTATYLYGASSDVHRRDMPNHLLQWSAIRLAQSAGLREYDLWGIPDAVGRAAAAGTDPMAVDPGSDPLAGVWRFKSGLPAAVRRTVGAWDLVTSPWRHRLFSAAATARTRVSAR